MNIGALMLGGLYAVFIIITLRMGPLVNTSSFTIPPMAVRLTSVWQEVVENVGGTSDALGIGRP